MPDIGTVDHLTARQLRETFPEPSPTPRRLAFLALIAIAAVTGFLVTDAGATTRAVSQAGPDLARLLRAMAGIKAMAALGLVALTQWRLGAPIGLGRWLAYGAACSAMVAGVGLIWGMAHLVLGAVLLHGGLIVVALMLWRDPAMAARLHAAVARRRQRSRLPS